MRRRAFLTGVSGIVGLATAGCLRGETARERWQVETEWGVFSSPTVADGVVYVGSEDGRLYAVDAETGRLAWDAAFEADDIITSSPTVADGVVFVGSGDGNLYAVDAKSATPAWDSPFETEGAVFSSPTVVDGVVYVGSEDGSIYAVDAGVDGSSEGSRVSSGTLGHHDEWAMDAATGT